MAEDTRDPTKFDYDQVPPELRMDLLGEGEHGRYSSHGSRHKTRLMTDRDPLPVPKEPMARPKTRERFSPTAVLGADRAVPRAEPTPALLQSLARTPFAQEAVPEAPPVQAPGSDISGERLGYGALSDIESHMRRTARMRDVSGDRLLRDATRNLYQKDYGYEQEYWDRVLGNATPQG